MKNYHLASWYIWWQLLCEPARPARSRFNQCFNCLCFLAVIFDFVWLFPPLPFPLLFIFIPLSKVCSLSSYNLSIFLSVRMLRTLLFYASQLTFAYIDQVLFLSMIFQNIKNWPDPTYYLPISFRGIAMIVTHQFAWLILGLYIYLTVIVCATFVFIILSTPYVLDTLADLICSRIERQLFRPPAVPAILTRSAESQGSSTPPPTYAQAINDNSEVHFARSQEIVSIITPTVASTSPRRTTLRFRSTRVWYVKSFFPYSLSHLRSLNTLLTPFMISSLIFAVTFYAHCPLSCPLSVIRVVSFVDFALYTHGKQILVLFFVCLSLFITMAQHQPKLKHFSSSDPLDWDIFLRNFRCYIGLLETAPNDKRKKGLLLCHLEGQAAQKAADFYDYLDDNTKTCDDLIKDLTQVFSPAASGDLAHGIWQHCRQEQNETIETWHTRCKMLYKRAFPDDTPDTSLHLIRHFIEFLFHPEYRPNVMLKRPQTYSAALKAAQEVVAAVSVNNPKLMREAAGGPFQPEIKQEVQAIGPYRPPSPAARRPVTPPPGITCHYCNKPGHVVKECDELTRAKRFLFPPRRSFTPNRNNSRGRSQSPYRRNQSPFRRQQSPSRSVQFQSRPQVNSIQSTDTSFPDEILDADAWESFFTGLDLNDE